MTLEELNETVTNPQKTKCRPCSEVQGYSRMEFVTGDLVVVTNADGKAEYKRLTQDGRLVPAEEW